MTVRSPAPRGSSRAAELLNHPSLEPRRIARAALPVIFVLGLLGLACYEKYLRTFLFGLDAEFNAPALWSFGLLAGAGGVALMTSMAMRSGAAAAFGAVLVYMAIDELFQIHERLERATGTDWQELYLPIVVLAGGAAIGVLFQMRKMGARTPALLLIGGGASWLVAQMLEWLQWDGTERGAGYIPMAVTEEMLEMGGALLFALALLVWTRDRH